MKRQILISLILLSSVLAINAQWSSTNPVYTNSNVGIGISNPISALDVNGTISIRQQGNGTTANPYETVALRSYVGDINAYPSINFINDWQNTHRSWMNFNVRDGNHNKITALTINGDGIIGIGLTTPYYRSKLHIKATFNDPWTMMVEANNNDRVIGMNHTGDFGVIAVSYLQGGGYTPLQFWTQNLPRMTINTDGKVGILTANPQYELDVIGTIRAREIKVDLNGADFVFEKDYKLMPLNELEKFVKEQKHLPEIAPAKEMEKNGTELGDLNSKLLQKMEEMTLYMIEQSKAIEELKLVVKVQSEKIKKLETASK